EAAAGEGWLEGELGVRDACRRFGVTGGRQRKRSPGGRSRQVPDSHTERARRPVPPTIRWRRDCPHEARGSGEWEYCYLRCRGSGERECEYSLARVPAILFGDRGRSANGCTETRPGRWARKRYGYGDRTGPCGQTRSLRKWRMGSRPLSRGIAIAARATEGG